MNSGQFFKTSAQPPVSRRDLRFVPLPMQEFGCDLNEFDFVLQK
jgi:hypothetical protein